MPAASAISLTVVARKPFCANNSPASLTTSARRWDRVPLDPAAVSSPARAWSGRPGRATRPRSSRGLGDSPRPGEPACPDDWLLRVGLTAPLWLVDDQPPKRLLACRARSRVLPGGRLAGSEGGAYLVGERHGDQ